ncbi:site-specific integrase [Streptomyces sp. NPDC002057]|uniref:site-specific integrase n=1 Tax=Streptomyces sp. NPDC002057 TaxID=3154664 RepID=UPI00332C6101
MSWYAADPVLAGLPTLAEWAHAHGTQLGQPVLLRADGWSVPEVNGFFASARMRNASTGTRRKYAFAVAVWLGFLDAAGRAWHDADEEDVAGFKFWRMTDEANVRRVAGGTVLDDLIAISAFYRWAGSRFGVGDPVTRRQVSGPAPGTVTESFEAGPHLVRGKDVKWLDPAGYACWVDVGLRGLDLRGREIDGWRGRNSQRDCAFVDGLYGTGLRLSEWASILRLELPADDQAAPIAPAGWRRHAPRVDVGDGSGCRAACWSTSWPTRKANAPQQSAALSAPAATSGCRSYCWSSVATDRDAEREAITAAIQRLLDGRPTRSTGALTTLQLAVEAGVKRWVLTHKTRRKSEVNGIPPVFQHLHARAVDAEAIARALREGNGRLRERVAVYAQVIHELRTELDRRTDIRGQRSLVRTLPTSPT